MNILLMTNDAHRPAFIRASHSSAHKEDNEIITPPMKQVRRFSWTRFIGLVIVATIVVGVVYLVSKLVTPQVVTAVSVIVGFLLLRFVVQVILQVTFTLLRYLFWIAILCGILLCML